MVQRREAGDGGGAAAAGWERGERQLARAYGLLVVVFVAACCALALAEHHRIANFDDWRILDARAERPLLSWAFGSQIGHHFPVTLLLLHLDQSVGSGRMHWLVVASLLCALAAAAVLRGALRASRDPAPWTQAATAFAVFLFFWANTGYAFLWGIMQGNLLAALAQMAALACLVHHVRDPRRRGWLVGAGLLAFVATFSHGMGFGVWAALVGVGLAAGIGRWRLAGLAVAGAVAVALYVAGLGDDPQGVPRWSLAAALASPGRIALFALAFLGGAAARVLYGLGVAAEGSLYAVAAGAGACGVLVLAGFVARRLRRDRGDAAALVGLGLGLCTAAGAVVVGALRFGGFGPEQAYAERFLAWSVLLWMAIGIAAPAPASRRGRVAGIAGLLLLSVATLPALGDLLAAHARRRAFLEDAALALLVGVQDDATAQLMSIVSPEVVYRGAERMRRDGRNVFADPRRDLPGTRLAEHFEVVSPARCEGALREVLPIATGPPAAFVSGRAWDRVGDRAPAFVAVTDPRGVVRGLANVRDGGVFRGYLGGFRPGRTYAFYAVLADGRSACPLATPGRRPARRSGGR